MDINSGVEALNGVGPALATKFKLLGINTINDLINYYPRRYDDYSTIIPLRDIKPGNAVTVKARITNANGRYVRRGMHITEALASDETGSIKLVWFNQPYRSTGIKHQASYFITGNFELSRGRLAILNPSIELESEFQVNTGRIVPVYKETKGLKSAAIRKIVASIKNTINELPETIPETLVKTHKLMSRSEALISMHFPTSMNSLERARHRLGYEEILGLSLASLLNKQQFSINSGVHVPFKQSIAQEFTHNLPYSLTNAQRRAAWQIFKDMEKTVPMNRLLEGDVGSGKTVVAGLATTMALHAGFQVAVMAPTELLARQLANNLTKLLKSTEYDKKVELLIGSITSSKKSHIHKRIESGETRLIVGTHALISQAVTMPDLGLVIVDEQHRFGVNQRKKLQSKAGKMPHVLSMTATPIPRTLALTLYGELDLSILDELPPGRIPIKTELVSPNSRTTLYERIRTLLNDGKQMFVVCPLIEDSDTIAAVSAEKIYLLLSKNIYPEKRVSILHGKMKAIEKESIMNRFANGGIDILVSTTVIEVGVDIPNATVMLIEGVERFGLAQIHQLRGRVGRRDTQGYCFLVMSDSKAPSKRLRALEYTTDGFKLAELDLDIRGPGAIYGHMQSGELDLRIANLSDARLIATARSSAGQIIKENIDISKYPELSSHVARYRAITNLN